MKDDRIYVWYCRKDEKPWHRCDKLLCTNFKINGFQSEFDRKRKLCGHQIWAEILVSTKQSDIKEVEE